MGKKAVPKEEDAAEKLKEKEFQEKIGSVVVQASVMMKDPKEQHPLKVKKETEDEQIAKFLTVCSRSYKSIFLLLRCWRRSLPIWPV
ncbi:hypothetical protein AHAS_Ahas17G0239500 [Arachis hypogaea]